MTGNNELAECLNYILNNSSDKEIDVIDAALKKRKEQMSTVFSLNGEEAAKAMAERINASINKSIDGMTNTLRDFSSNLISQEAPELSKSQVNALVESWIPSHLSTGERKSVSENGKVNGIPSDAMFDMICQFVSYGIGEMADKENQLLKTEIGDWTGKYWKIFPIPIQKEIRNFINGKITSKEFTTCVKTLLS